jgi:hypothetical protein
MLRGDNPAIFDVGPHPRRRGCASEEIDGEESIFVNQDLPRGKKARLPNGSLSRPLLQLQLRDRIMGLLSARQFASHEIPATVRACFKAEGGLKPKDLLMIPARVALALQADGWWLRSEIIWSKSAPMPESVRDRPTCAHEKVFLLTKAASYFYDADAVREPPAKSVVARSAYMVGGTKVAKERNDSGMGQRKSFADYAESGANLRNVWYLNQREPFPGAHFATMPTTLAERCIKAGSRPGDTILDPFAGAGTTLLVADRLQRHGIGIELNQEYAAMAGQRLVNDAPLFAEVV